MHRSNIAGGGRVLKGQLLSERVIRSWPEAQLRKVYLLLMCLMPIMNGDSVEYYGTYAIDPLCWN